MQASGGDMRKAVTYLQTAHQLSDGIPVTSEDIVDISGQVCDIFLSIYQFHYLSYISILRSGSS
jgi:hypothetical protein